MPAKFRLFVTSVVLILGLALHGCYADIDLVKGGVVSIGSKLYLLVESDQNELVIGTSQPGDIFPSHREYKGKPRSEKEIIEVDKSTQVVTSLKNLKRPVPGTLIIEFTPKYIIVHEGDGSQEATKHRRRQKSAAPLIKSPA